MKEHQTVEFKESWHSEYLEWICGYANAQGGILYIGRDDEGSVTGIGDAETLLERIPNQITDTMGIVADVNLCTQDGREYLEIIVDKYPTLISYHGRYFYRSGSTMRTITGKELDRAILKSQGRTWDGMPVLRLRLSDLQKEAIELFRKKAVESGRLTREEADVSDQLLFENLHLFDDNGYLTRAAMLAFYHDPEKWVTGSYIKIGFFGDSDSDLRYQDEIHGALIGQVDKAMDLLYTKYMKALISYRDIQRVEQFMFHRSAMREILLNAVVHKDYAGCNPIQVSVYEDRVYIWNDGEMPEELSSTEKLFAKHSSKPFNPKLANVFFKSGMIEAWGRGFDKIRAGCEAFGGPLPEYEITQSGVMVLCRACDAYMHLLNDGRRTYPGQNPERAPQLIQDADPVAAYRNPAVQERNPAIREENPAIQEKNLAIQAITLAIEQSGYTRAAKQKMLKLVSELETQEFWGTREAADVLDCSVSAARALIVKMREIRILIPVKGRGKGKYAWNTKR